MTFALRMFASAAMLAGLLVGRPVHAAGPKKLHTIRFASSGFRLSADERAKLDEVAARLDAGQLAAVRLVGHTDRHGDPIANQRLGLRRAQSVQRILIQSGVPSDRIRVESAGMHQPLDARRTRQADALNRRVEVWVATRGMPRMAPPAWVSWIFKDVQTRRSAAPDWDPAELNEPLQPLDRVRTLGASAGEITFRTLDRLRLGPEASVVIYRGRAVPPRRVARLDDVFLEEGALFAQLAQKDRPLRLTSPAANVDLTASDARIEHSDRRSASTVSVYEGRARVAAAGKRVRVNKGFGTRVKKGAAPEPPTPLPAAPAWLNEETVVVFGDESPSLAWTRPPNVSEAVLEMARDEGMGPKVVRTVVTASGAVRLAELEVGRYDLRLRGRDAKGLVGTPSGARALVVLPARMQAPRRPTPQGVASTYFIEDGALRLAVPGTVVLDIPDGLSIQSPHGSVAEGRWAVEAPAPGRYEFPFALSAQNDNWKHGDRLIVEVASPPAPPEEPEVRPTPAAVQPPVPPPAVAAVAPSSGLLASGLRFWLGATVNASGAFEPVVLVDYSWQRALTSSLYGELGLETGWTRTAGDDDLESSDRVELVPIRIRGALGTQTGAYNLYLGGAGGLALAAGRIVPQDGAARTYNVPQLSWRGFVGAGRSLGAERRLYLEVSGTRLALEGTDRLLENRLSLQLGLRL